MKTIYKGQRTLVDPKTGEKYQVADILKTVTAENFVKVHLVDFLMSLGLFGGKSEHVYLFVLQHISFRTNKLKMTNNQIRKGMAKEGHKVSMATIKRALSKLEHTRDSNGHNLIRRKRYGRYGRHSYIMLDPDLAMVGKEKHKAGLFIQYNKAKSTKKNTTSNTNKQRTAKARRVLSKLRQASKAKTESDRAKIAEINKLEHQLHKIKAQNKKSRKDIEEVNKKQLINKH